MALKNYYRSGFRLLRKSQSANAWGGEDAGAWTEVCCFSGFLQPTRGDERDSNAKVTHDFDHRLYCDADLPINAEDAVEFDSKTYIVSFVQDYGISGLEKHQEVYVRWTDALS